MEAAVDFSSLSSVIGQGLVASSKHFAIVHDIGLEMQCWGIQIITSLILLYHMFLQTSLFHLIISIVGIKCNTC